MHNRALLALALLKILIPRMTIIISIIRGISLRDVYQSALGHPCLCPDFLDSTLRAFHCCWCMWATVCCVFAALVQMPMCHFLLQLWYRC